MKPGDILEGHVDLVFLGQFAGGLAHVEYSASGTVGTAAHVPVESAEHPDPHQDKEHERENPFENM